jgi:hypothetical protein
MRALATLDWAQAEKNTCRSLNGSTLGRDVPKLVTHHGPEGHSYLSDFPNLSRRTRESLRVCIELDNSDVHTTIDFYPDVTRFTEAAA